MNLWDLECPGKQFALNTRVIRLHGSAPFSLFFARSFPGFSRAALSPPQSTQIKDNMISADSNSSEAVEDWLEIITQMESVVYPAVRAHRDAHNARRMLQFNKSHKLVSFPVGSFVMAKDPIRAGKLSPIFEGPYRIAKRNRGGAYQLLD